MNASPASPSTLTKSDASGVQRSSRLRTLWLACVAHALHDGYSNMIYVLLPVWQAEFGLSFGALSMLSGVYVGTMAVLQLPAGMLARLLGPRATLTLGTLLAALGYAAAGLSGSLLGLAVALAVSGSGSSTQHPLASSAVSRAFGSLARGPLSIYNFAGDVGKAALPAAISLLMTVVPWHQALWVASALGVAVAAGIALSLPSGQQARPAAERKRSTPSAALGAGFRLLLTIGVLDTGVRMGLLTFLPFLLKAKGASTPVIGIALALVFTGGAAGKFACGWLGERIGVIRTVLATEGATGFLIVAIGFTPLVPSLAILPLLGVMLNGTSSVLYGTVPELAPLDGAERAFALFYTGTIGSGAIAPMIYGFLGDRIGIDGATFTSALTAWAIIPLTLGLGRYLVAGGNART
jgi:FSR family fosmidomycin resistance protein-like MFS transporter